MCGNFSVNIEEDFYPRFKVKEKIKYSNSNIRPTSQAPIIMNEESGNHLKLAEWSLIPRESEAGKKYSTFNARFEGLLDSRLYHEPFKHTRCIVPMNNYFEWHKVDEKEKKDKYSISNSKQKYVGVAGLFKVWDIHGKEILCFTIITKDANSQLSKIHGRMPIVLDEKSEAIWIDPESKIEKLQQVLEQSGDMKYDVFKV